MSRKIVLTVVGSGLLALLVQIPLAALAVALVGPWLGIGVPLLLNLAALIHHVTAARHRPLAAWFAPVDVPFFVWFFGSCTYAIGWGLLWAAAAICQRLHPELGAWLLAQVPAPLAAGSLGVAALTVLTRHRRVRVRTVPVRLPRLPAAFDGYRILHMSDVHVGPMVPPERVRRWVEKANRLEPDLVALTGDYIVTGTEYHRAAASVLGGLRAKDGVYASMGNHDYFGDGEAMARALTEAGLWVLRNRGVVIRRQGSELYLAGVDDTWCELADVPAALAGRPPGAATVLLAHDPDLLPEAARHGVDLMLSGHTHGGQIGIPLFAKQLNFSRPITRLTAGIYREARTTLYVTRGVGTTFIPLRVGVPPELAVIVLRRA